MKKRVKGHLYFLQNFKYNKGEYHCVTSADGTLLASNFGRTKIYASELPEWFVYGRYYKRFGYLSTKGITALKYIPNKHSNHYLKDDRLMISYGKTESELDDENKYEVWIWGNEILDILQGAKIYSGYDIEPILAQLKDKEEWLRSQYPDEFGEAKWHFDLYERMQRPFANGLPPRYGAITIKPSFNSDAEETLYGSEDKLTKFIVSLPNEYRKEKDAFSLRSEDCVREVMFLKESFGYIEGFEFTITDSKGEAYDLCFYSVLLTQIILRDADRNLLCASADIIRLKFRKQGDADWIDINDVNKTQVVVKSGNDTKELNTQAFIEVGSYPTATEAVSALRAVKPSIETLVKYVFEIRI